MIRTFARAALVALTVGAGFAGLGAVPASAATIVIDDYGVRVDPVQYRDYDRYERRDRRDRDRFDDRRGGSCSSRLAIRKAYDIGLNRPRIAREGRRTIVVDGYRRGRLASVRFANDRGCPVLSVGR